MTAPAPLGLTPELPNAICPCCGKTVMHPWITATWRGQRICLFCKADLEDVEAEDARQQIAKNYLYLGLREG